MIKKLYNILERQDRLRFLMVIILMAVAGVLETLSIGILIPFVTFLLDPALLLEHPIIIEHFYFLTKIDQDMLIYYLLLLIFICFFLKTLYFIWFHYIKNKFIFLFTNKLITKLFSSYIAKPYSLYLDDSSHNQLSTVVNEVGAFEQGIVIAGIEGLSEIIIVFFLVALLFVVNPAASLAIVLIGITLFAIFNILTKKKTLKWGYIRQKNEARIVEKLQQSYNGLKEILVYLKESFFINTFENVVKETTSVNIKKQTLLDIPKSFIEIIAIIIFIVVILIIYFNNPNPSYFIPILGLYVGVSFKLMPALNRIVVSSQRFRNATATFDKITNEVDIYNKNLELINEIKKEKIVPIKFEEKISFNNILFKYPSKNTQLFNDLSFAIRKGETIGIKGQSGEGKSTLINMICGFIIPDKGEILIDEKYNIQKNMRGWRSILGYIPQQTYLFNGSIKENICFSQNGPIDEKSFSDALNMAQLRDLVDSSPQKENTQVGERGMLLSGGQTQRIALARCLYKNPEILILDEATSSLDETNEKKILEAIRLLKGTKTIIIVSHRDSTLSFCDRILYLNKNKLSEKK
ncbi:ABC transporter ATP-binding protein/permease [Candidatus Pelagibacter sp.]|jgi:ATP-binding cassette, subfamily B, bacterial PglK|nr:ABC transporter ATP-binding protein/permease [Candidatus Pelagibacter sp.]